MTDPYCQDERVTLWHGDCLDVLPALPDASVDSVVTDPPYELGFMGKGWDATGIAYNVTVWRECLRVLKPGGHLLAFGGTRTWHRLAVAIEDAGFEVRDSIAWLYGSGFPKSLDVSKAIDKAAGAEREVVGLHAAPARTLGNGRTMDGGAAQDAVNLTAPATPDAVRWSGWGTALKPSHEPVVWGVKPVTACGMLSVIGSHLDRLEEACRPSASDAGPSSAHTRADSPEARTAIAPARAATRHEAAPARTTPTGAAGVSSEATATSVSEWTGETFWSTVTSWRKCWAELCEATSTSTTSTATSRTTDLQTLSSCLSQITQSVTATSTPEPDSLRSIVTAADNLFAAGVLNSRSTLALSAAESATASTPRASQGAGGGSPAFEPIVVARKPLAGTVAANVLAHGTGALNIDGCRVGLGDERPPTGSGVSLRATSTVSPYRGGDGPNVTPTAGRWPANVVLDRHAAAELDRQSGESSSRVGKPRGAAHGEGWGMTATGAEYADTGGASRFFYVAKAPTSERPRVGGIAHPTVKPLDLMRWLVRLVTPPGGTVLEPFAGSGTTAEACVLEGFQCIAI